MPLPRVRFETFEIGDLDIHVRTLRDSQQFHDPEGVAEALGISSASWALFGVIWRSSHVLSALMSELDIEGLRILEVGCGIGLASLVLSSRGADISATDAHPSAGAYLEYNTQLNGLAAIPFVCANWTDPSAGRGDFDLLIASDVLYEPDHAEVLAAFMHRQARATAKVVVVDPGRSFANRFARSMASFGFARTTMPRADLSQLCGGDFSGTIATFCRASVKVSD